MKPPDTHPTITVLGAGYVGLTTSTLLAHAGFTVYIIEPNQKRLEAIQAGRSFFFEAGLDPLISGAVESGSLIPTSSYEDSVPKSEIVISCVGTPDNPDGSSNLTYVFDAAAAALQYLGSGSIYVQKSTVPVGTGEKIEQLFSASNRQIAYVSNPEFLREGTALFDTLYFDRVVVGGRDEDALMAVLGLYQQLEDKRDAIAQLASIAPSPRIGRYITTGLNSAELIKVTANAFLALKISFANSIAQLADKVGADVTEVMDAVGADERIGRKFLNAGRGYGGGCFPKDVSGLIASGRDHGVELPIMTAAQAVNDMMPGYIIEKMEHALGHSVAKTNVTVLGLSFKAGTSDVRRSPGVHLANTLQELGAHVTGYDPAANQEASPSLSEGITLADTLETAIDGSDAVLVATEWPAFLTYPPHNYKQAMAGTVFVDAINQFSKVGIADAGLTYVGVGR